MVDHLSESEVFGQPVLIIVFNREATIRKLLDRLREVKPRQVFVASDGAREDRPGESEQVARVRETVLSGIDWDCEVKTLFRQENLGCRVGISESISWFFDHVEAGVILEDDCFPSLDYFTYMDDLLGRYADDERVMHVGGSVMVDISPIDDSYYFSRYPMIWGFATWRRAWALHSIETPSPEELETVVAGFRTKEERKYWRKLLGWYYEGGMDTWDYPWANTIWRNDGVAISAAGNLVSNIGFGAQSTNMKRWKDYRGFSDRAPVPLGEIRHPESQQVNEQLDQEVFTGIYRRPAPPALAWKLISHMARITFSRRSRD